MYEIHVLKRNDTWLHAKNLLDEDIQTRYIYSFYFLAVTMTTVGYGTIYLKIHFLI